MQKVNDHAFLSASALAAVGAAVLWAIQGGEAKKPDISLDAPAAGEPAAAPQAPAQLESAAPNGLPMPAPEAGLPAGAGIAALGGHEQH